MKALTTIVLSLLILTQFCLGDDGFQDRKSLTFRIEAVFDNQKEGPGIDQFEIIGLKGNGLGLSWDKLVNLEQVDADLKLWSLEFTYDSTQEGVTCENCSPDSIIKFGEDFEFTVVAVTNQGEEVPMRGPNFRISFPLSKVSGYFGESPNFSVYPYFGPDSGSILLANVPSASDYIGSDRTTWIYLPPSYKLNPKPTYDVIFLLDYGPALGDFFTPLLDQAFGSDYVQDAIVIGFGDYSPTNFRDRSNLLTQVPGIDGYDCISGTILDLCDGCIDEDFDITNLDNNEYMYWMTEGGCGKPTRSIGLLEETLDHLLLEVLPYVDQTIRDETNGKTRLTTSRMRTSIMGYSLGGLASCYAAWTRPESFGNAVCSSPSTWFPHGEHVPGSVPKPLFNIINETLQTNRENRPRQSILIDTGVEEGGDIFGMNEGAVEMYDIMLTKTTDGTFETNKNLWINSYPGETHGFDMWTHRMWLQLKLLSKNRPYVYYAEY